MPIQLQRSQKYFQKGVWGKIHRAHSVHARKSIQATIGSLTHELKEFSEALSYRRPVTVQEVVYFRREQTSYPKCPRCKCTMEREYMAYCDRCGQRLRWGDYDKTMVELK